MMQGIKLPYLPLSWALWQRLLYPRSNAVFQRVMTQTRHYRLSLFHLCLMMSAAGGLSYGIVRLLKPLQLEFPVMALIVLSVFSVIITGVWIALIASAITHEYQQGTYDLLGVTPAGKMGADWSIATGILHRQDLFRRFDIGRRWFSGIILFVFMAILIPVVLSTVLVSGIPPLEVILLFFEVLAFVIFTYVEYSQSVLQGVFIAMLLPRVVQRPLESTIWAISAFIIVQIVLLIVFLVGTVFIQVIFVMNGWQHSSILLQLLLLFVIREACIYSLWIFLMHHLNDDAYAGHSFSYP